MPRLCISDSRRPGASTCSRCLRLRLSRATCLHPETRHTMTRNPYSTCSEFLRRMWVARKLTCCRVGRASHLRSHRDSCSVDASQWELSAPSRGVPGSVGARPAGAAVPQALASSRNLLKATRRRRSRAHGPRRCRAGGGSSLLARSLFLRHCWRRGREGR